MAKCTVDDSRDLDVWAFQRAGCFTPGMAGGWSWWRGETKTASIGYRCLRAGEVWLTYTVTGPDGRRTDHDYAVRLTEAHRRVWWACPGCGRRARKLYLPPSGDWFACRRCYDLSYASRQERSSRGLWAHTKLRELEAQLYRLPAGTSGRKVRRLAAEVGRLRDRTEADFRAFIDRADRFLARRGIPRREPPASLLAPAPALPPGRPKEKRAYVRRQARPTLAPAGADLASCVKCRDRRRLLRPRRVTLASGRPALRGRCAECRTRLCRILPADTA